MSRFFIGKYSGVTNSKLGFTLNSLTADSKKVKKEKKWTSSYSKETVIEIRRRFEKDHARIADLAKEFGLTKTTVANIVHYYVHRHISID